jgi:hypothetical protein
VDDLAPGDVASGDTAADLGVVPGGLGGVDVAIADREGELY